MEWANGILGVATEKEQKALLTKEKWESYGNEQQKNSTKKKKKRRRSFQVWYGYFAACYPGSGRDGHICIYTSFETGKRRH